MRFLHFILSHSIFIACCALGLCYQTNVILHLPHDFYIYGFLFFSTLSGYNFYWLLSKFYFYGRNENKLFLKSNISFLVLFLLGIIGTFYFLLYILSLWVYILISVLLTLLYSLPLWPFKSFKKLQQLGFFKTVLLSFTWAYITTVLPANTMMQLNLFPVFLLFIARFCFMLLLCIIFDKRDISVDKLHGLHSIATDISNTTLTIIINTVFVGYFIIGLVLRYEFHNKPQMFAFLITGAFVWVVYNLSLKKRGYIFYYFLVDGLMLLGAVGTFIATLF